VAREALDACNLALPNHPKVAFWPLIDAGTRIFDRGMAWQIGLRRRNPPW
jgi:hypothetical protein